MLVFERGHVYHLKEVPWGESSEVQIIRFRNVEPGKRVPGVTTQEILRVLIDRTHYCNNCLPHPVNERIIHHLRMALVLHESRALERKTLKGDIFPEEITTGNDGHFILPEGENCGDVTRYLDPVIDPEALIPSYSNDDADNG